MQWNLGDCTIAVGRGSTEVVCPDLTVTGPLVISTIGEPLAQPTRFTVRYSSIIDAEALSDDDIDTAVICRRLGRLRPTTAASTFTESCTPIYTGQAAEVLLTVLEGGYTAEG